MTDCKLVFIFLMCCSEQSPQPFYSYRNISFDLVRELKLLKRTVLRGVWWCVSVIG